MNKFMERCKKIIIDSGNTEMSIVYSYMWNSALYRLSNKANRTRDITAEFERLSSEEYSYIEKAFSGRNPVELIVKKDSKEISTVLSVPSFDS